MTQFERLKQTTFNSQTYQVETPEGTMYVNLIEDNSGKLIALDASIGKAGSVIRAWAMSLSKIMTVAIEHGARIEHLIEELSSQTSDKPARRRSDGVQIRSGPDGICFVLLCYRREKSLILRKEMGLGTDVETERTGRGPRMAR